MKFIRIATLSFAVVFCSLFAQTVEAQLKIDCKSVAERVQTAIEAKPDQVLTIVEDALVAYTGCVDVIVKTAIESSKADAKTIKQIVLVAVTTAEKDAPQIAESAVAAAPDHADAVREAFAEAYQKKSDREKEAVKIDPVETTKPVAMAENPVPERIEESSTPTKAVAESKSAVESTSETAGEVVKLNSIPDDFAATAATEQKDSKQLVLDSYSDKEAKGQSFPSQTSTGKAVVGEISMGGKAVINESGKAVITDGGKDVIYDGGINYLKDGKEVAYDGVGYGEAAARKSSGAGSGGYGGSGSSSGSNASFGYGPVDLSGVYMIPPSATAAPIVEEKVSSQSSSGNRFRTRRRTVTRSIPMSPTNP